MISQRQLLELQLGQRLRTVSGDAFQRFTGDVLRERHGVLFVPTRPYGQLGDDGCDGFIQGIGAFVACYGKVDDSSLNVKTTVDKANADFNKANAEFPGQIREWYFVNNLLDGVPSELVKARNELEAKHPHIRFVIAGYAWFLEQFDKLTLERQEALLGPLRLPGRPDDFDYATLGMVLDGLDDAARTGPPVAAVARPVPIDKLDINNLSAPYRQVIKDGWIWNDNIRATLSLDLDRMRAERIASYFRRRYQELKANGLSPDGIFSALFESAQGNRSMPGAYVPVAAVVAHYFDACDIFEGVGEG